MSNNKTKCNFLHLYFYTELMWFVNNRNTANLSKKEIKLNQLGSSRIVKKIKQRLDSCFCVLKITTAVKGMKKYSIFT